MLQITFKSRTLVNNAFGENIQKNSHVQNTYKSLMCLIENKESLRYRYTGFKGVFFEELLFGFSYITKHIGRKFFS